MKIYITKKQIYNIKPGTTFIYKWDRQPALAWLLNVLSNTEHKTYLSTEQDICTVAANLLWIDNEEYFWEAELEYLYDRSWYGYDTLQIVKETKKYVTVKNLNTHRWFSDYKIKKDDLMYKDLYTDLDLLKTDIKTYLETRIKEEEASIIFLKNKLNEI